MTKISKGELRQLQRFAVQCELIESGHWRDYEPEQLKDPLVLELELLDVALDGRVLTKRWLEHWLPFLASGVLTRIFDTHAGGDSQSLAAQIADDLFTDVRGVRCQRLIMTNQPHGGTGWSAIAVQSRIQRILEGTA